MKMSDYSCYCTPEQTIKALGLGMSIKRRSDNYDLSNRYFRFKLHHSKYGNTGYYYVECPTVEQMLGWLRSKNIKFHFDDETNYWSIDYVNDDISPLRWCDYSDNKEFAAINAALDYLIYYKNDK